MRPSRVARFAHFAVKTQTLACHCAEGPQGLPAHSSAQPASYGVADHSADGVAVGVADEQTLEGMNAPQDTSLEVAGFAGTVAEAYASLNYV